MDKIDQIPTANMALNKKTVFDVAIIGGGVMGSSIAYHLCQLGCRNIVVIEKDSTYKSASAMLSAGGIRQQFSVPENALMSKYGIEFLKNPSLLAVDSTVAQAHPQLSATAPGWPNYQFNENGYLFLASLPSGQQQLESNDRMYRSLGITWVRLMDKSNLSKLFPWLNTDDVLSGSFGTMNEGYFDPWSLLQALRTKALSMGAVYLEGDIYCAKMMERDKAKFNNVSDITSVYVQTNNDIKEVSARKFVNACGPWAGQLVDNLASHTRHPVSPVPVKARRRAIFNFHCRREAFVDNNSVTPLVVDPTGVWFRSEGSNGHFICGTSPSINDEDPDCQCSDALSTDQDDQRLFDEVLWPVLFHRVPMFGALKLQSTWAGFYEYNTFDQNAIIGYHPNIGNLVLCNGFSGHGLQHSPAAGRGVAELLVHGQFKSIDLSIFSYDRILNNTPIHEVGIV